MLLALARAVCVASESLGTRNHILLSQIRNFALTQSESESYVTTTVSPPVRLGIKHPSEAYDQIFITVGQLRVC
jgi:hypothetical protein